MRISKVPGGNDIYYYALDSHREGKKVVTKVLVSFGSHSQLLKEHPDPEAYCQAEVARMNEERSQQKLEYTRKVDFSERVECDGDRTASGRTSRNLGWLYLRGIIRRLGIGDYLDSIPGKRKYSLSGFNEAATAMRILDPCSKRRTVASAGEYLGMPEVQLHDAYRALKLIGERYEEYQSALLRGARSLVELDTEVIYCDATNVYFECESADEDVLDGDGDVVQYGLRKYGASKEHRPNPIVQIGMFVDRNGIPLSFSLHPGNVNEQSIVIPDERRTLADLGPTSFVYCADGGLNSAAIRLFNSVGNRHYVVTQSLRKLKRAELELILKDANWRFLQGDEPVSLDAFRGACERAASGEELSDSDRRMLERDMIYKRFPYRRRVDPAQVFPGARNAAPFDIEETLVVTFSARYFLYERGVFGKQYERAERMVESGRDPARRNVNDPARLVSEVAFTPDGEVAPFRARGMDSERAEDEMSLHGFYACATDMDRPAREILDITKNRWRIEMNFRIMKSFMGVRPVYLSTPEGIMGHVCLCFAALLVYSILERAVNFKERKKSSIGDIIETLRNMRSVEEEHGYYRALYTGSEVLDRLERAYGLGLDRKYRRTKDLEKLIG